MRVRIALVIGGRLLAAGASANVVNAASDYFGAFERCGGTTWQRARGGRHQWIAAVEAS